MSFDPHKLFTHPQKKSHQGQIIQKRPVDPHYAASHEDLKRAIIVAKTYGYSLVRGLTGFDYSMYSGKIYFDTSKRYIDLKDMFNSDQGDALRFYNNNIFKHRPTNVRIIVQISLFSIESTSGSVTVYLCDGTHFNISSFGYLLIPQDQNTIALIRLGTYSKDDIVRGQSQNYNSGVIFDTTDSMLAYNCLKSGPAWPGENVRYINCVGGTNVSGYMCYTLTLIVNY